MAPTLWTFFIGCGKKLHFFRDELLGCILPFHCCIPRFLRKKKPNSCPYCAGWITEQLIVWLTGIAIDSGESGRQEHDAWKWFLWGQVYCCQIALHTFHSGVLVIPLFVSLVKPLVISACFMGSGLHFSLWVQHCHLTWTKLFVWKFLTLLLHTPSAGQVPCCWRTGAWAVCYLLLKYIIHTRAHLQTAS
jgi:hypothetical protein